MVTAEVTYGHKRIRFVLDGLNEIVFLFFKMSISVKAIFTKTHFPNFFFLQLHSDAYSSLSTSYSRASQHHTHHRGKVPSSGTFFNDNFNEVFCTKHGRKMILVKEFVFC
jgi:hypothetical protein